MGGRSFRLPLDNTTTVDRRAIFSSSAILRLEGTYFKVEGSISVSTVSRQTLPPVFLPCHIITKIRKYLHQLRGDLGLLANTKPLSEPRPPRHLTEAQFHFLNNVLSHSTDIGISREESYGLSHPHTLHASLIAGTAYFHLGQEDEAIPILEQVFILSDLKSCAEQTIETAELLHYYYHQNPNFNKRFQALEKKGVHPKLR